MGGGDPIEGVGAKERYPERSQGWTCDLQHCKTENQKLLETENKAVSTLGIQLEFFWSRTHVHLFVLCWFQRAANENQSMCYRYLTQHGKSIKEAARLTSWGRKKLQLACAGLVPLRHWVNCNHAWEQGTGSAKEQTIFFSLFSLFFFLITLTFLYLKSIFVTILLMICGFWILEASGFLWEAFLKL